MITPEGILIRRLRRNDREAIREMLRQGGQRGNPLSRYIEDEELVLRMLVDYYVDYEPECCVVAEIDGEVVGCVLGSRDSHRYDRIMLTRYLPRLLGRVIYRMFTLQYRTMKNYRIIWWFLTRAWREIPGSPGKDFPLSVHITVSKNYRGYRLGRRLIDAAAENGRLMGLPGGHGVVVEEAHRNVFARTLGATLLETKRTTFWKHFSDEDWDFKLLTKVFTPRGD